MNKYIKFGVNSKKTTVIEIKIWPMGSDVLVVPASILAGLLVRLTN